MKWWGFRDWGGTNLPEIGSTTTSIYSIIIFRFGIPYPARSIWWCLLISASEYCMFCLKMEISSKVRTQKGLFKTFFPCCFQKTRIFVWVCYYINQYASSWYILDLLGKLMEALTLRMVEMPGGWRRTLALLAGQLMWAMKKGILPMQLYRDYWVVVSKCFKNVSFSPQDSYFDSYFSKGLKPPTRGL